jgi:membrane protein
MESRRATPSPLHIPADGWLQVLRRCFWRVFHDRLFGEAAAVAFYALIAIFPALAALVTLCGLFVDPEGAAQYFQILAGTLPAGAADVARDVLGRSGAAGGGGRVGLAAGLAATALWSATVAAAQLFGALNVAYRLKETRNIIRLYSTGIVFALGAVIFVVLALGGLLGVPVALNGRVGSDGNMDKLLHLLRWPVLLAFASITFAVTYRQGPCLACPRWR